MCRGVSMVWHRPLPFMNSFNKSKTTFSDETIASRFSENNVHHLNCQSQHSQESFVI